MGRRTKQSISEGKQGREFFHRSRVASCAKIAFHTRADAKRAARHVKTQTGRMRPYHCETCGFWHLGHMPQSVRQGEPWRKLGQKRAV